jgi:membrane protease YdiL (CAAX protease family)
LTEASDPEEPSPPAPEAPTDGPAPVPASPPYLGLTTFTVEGRKAPGLFVVGWLATLVGAGLWAIRAAGITGLPGAVVLLVALLAVSAGMVMLAGSQTIERRAAGAPRTGPSPLIVIVAGFSTYALLAFIAGVALLPFASSIPVAVGDLTSVLLQAAAFFGVVRLLAVGQGVLSWAAMGWIGDRAAAIRGLAGGAVFAGPVILVTAVVASAIVSVAGVSPPSPLPPTGTAAGLLLHLLAGAVVAPLSEELLFRGYALSAWRRLVGTRAAITWSSIVFVLAHVLFVSGSGFGETARLALVAGVVRVPVAFVLGWLFVRTGSIWAPVGLHAAFNGILIVVAEVAGAS